MGSHRHFSHYYCRRGGWVYLVKFEQEKPTIQLLPDKKYLGQNLAVIVEDQKSGVAEV